VCELLTGTNRQFNFRKIEDDVRARAGMNSQTLELIVIGVAMLFFLLLSAAAVFVFVRQYRREHKRVEKPRE
jgi:heme/copper-type cytochrome/quinol oxidase subunit 2